MKLPKEEIDERIREASGFVGVPESLFDKSPLELSGGQKRRVAIAGVIAMRPGVLVLDEPTAGLDPEGCASILKNITDYREATGATVILVSHSMTNDFTYYLAFLVFFALTLIILTVLGNILNLSFKFPEMDKLNDIGGISAGAVTGLMFCIIIVWALKFTGLILPEAEMKRTLLTALFLKLNILSQFLTV